MSRRPSRRTAAVNYAESGSDDSNAASSDDGADFVNDSSSDDLSGVVELVQPPSKAKPTTAKKKAAAASKVKLKPPAASKVELKSPAVAKPVRRVSSGAAAGAKPTARGKKQLGTLGDPFAIDSSGDDAYAPPLLFKPTPPAKPKVPPRAASAPSLKASRSLQTTLSFAGAGAGAGAGAASAKRKPKTKPASNAAKPPSKAAAKTARNAERPPSDGATSDGSVAPGVNAAEVPAKAVKNKTKKAAATPSTLPANDKVESPDVDFEGDAGAIGRVNAVRDSLVLDLKGQQYTGRLFPCNTFLVVGITPTEAKVECVVSNYVQLDSTQDVVGAMAGVFTEGTADEALFNFQDVDVNRNSRRGTTGTSDADDNGAGGNKRDKAGRSTAKATRGRRLKGK